MNSCTEVLLILPLPIHGHTQHEIQVTFLRACCVYLKRVHRLVLELVEQNFLLMVSWYNESVTIRVQVCDG